MAFFKPKDGVMVPDMARRDYVPPEGREIGDPNADGYYWQRRVDEGAGEFLDEKAAAESLKVAEDARAAAAAADAKKSGDDSTKGKQGSKAPGEAGK